MVEGITKEERAFVRANSHPDDEYYRSMYVKYEAALTAAESALSAERQRVKELEEALFPEPERQVGGAFDGFYTDRGAIMEINMVVAMLAHDPNAGKKVEILNRVVDKLETARSILNQAPGKGEDKSND